MNEQELRRQSDALALRLLNVEKGLTAVDTSMGFVREDIADLKRVIEAGSSPASADDLHQCQLDLQTCGTEIKTYKRMTWVSVALILAAGVKQLFQIGAG